MTFKMLLFADFQLVAPPKVMSDWKDSTLPLLAMWKYARMEPG